MQFQGISPSVAKINIDQQITPVNKAEAALLMLMECSKAMAA
jgi:hypothetical protein